MLYNSFSFSFFLFATVFSLHLITHIFSISVFLFTLFYEYHKSFISLYYILSVSLSLSIYIGMYFLMLSTPSRTTRTTTTNRVAGGITHP